MPPRRVQTPRSGTRSTTWRPRAAGGTIVRWSRATRPPRRRGRLQRLRSGAARLLVAGLHRTGGVGEHSRTPSASTSPPGTSSRGVWTSAKSTSPADHAQAPGRQASRRRSGARKIRVPDRQAGETEPHLPQATCKTTVCRHSNNFRAVGPNILHVLVCRENRHPKRHRLEETMWPAAPVCRHAFLRAGLSEPLARGALHVTLLLLCLGEGHHSPGDGGTRHPIPCVNCVPG